MCTFDGGWVGRRQRLGGEGAGALVWVAVLVSTRQRRRGCGEVLIRHQMDVMRGEVRWWMDGPAHPFGSSATSGRSAIRLKRCPRMCALDVDVSDKRLPVV
eukprot:262247-Chlamydomonas_euryale.AAC.1